MFAPDMSAEEFLACGDEILKEIARLLSNPSRVPVLSRAEPGSIRAQLPSSPPEEHEEMGAILEDFRRILMPGMTHWNHPGFMAYFANSAPGPGILAETLTAALNQNAMLWRTSPAATELEEVVMVWLADLLGIEGMTGIITDTASISSMLAIAAARENIPGLNIREEGLAGRPEVPRLRLYTSEQAHSSIEKAAIALGIGQRGVCKIPTNRAFQMDAEALKAAIEKDRAAGVLPFCVAATVGTTSTTSVDPVSKIADICAEEGLWLHVDAAYAGSAAIVPELRWLMDGCDRADSLVVNPHKWLFTPMDCSALYMRKPETLRRAFSLIPEYLVTEGEVTNYMDWGVQLGRRFRALKLWMILRYFGRKGLIDLIRGHVALAKQFADWIDTSMAFVRTAPCPLSAVCFRAEPVNVIGCPEKIEQLNNALMQRINASGKIFLSHTKLNGEYTLRIAIGNIRTGQPHLDTLKSLLNEELLALLNTGEY
jgi:aromatic-L-amino-acid/L-tryptophan decarboxylase